MQRLPNYAHPPLVRRRNQGFDYYKAMQGLILGGLVAFLPFGLLRRSHSLLHLSASMTPTTITPQALIAAIEEIRETGIAFLTLVVAAVAVRMYVRIIMLKKFGLEDWAMVLTFLVSVAHISMSITNSGLAIELTKGDIKVYNLYINLFKACGATYIATLISIKISLGFFFINIFSHRRGHRIAIYIMMVLSTVIGLAYLPIGNFTCAQFKEFPGMANNCPASLQRSANVLFVMFSVINIVSDFALSGMACGALWVAKLPLPTKVSAGLLLCLGSVGGVASTIRLGIWLTPADDAKYTQETLALVRWILIELAFSVVAANLAMVRPLFQAMLVKLGLMSLIETTMGTKPATRNTKKSIRNGSHGEEQLMGEVKRTMTILVEEEHAPEVL
ncbi:hypothetical protein ANO11243_071660 [Dothideomycetidae sp. 11243]|nr:hypothetical protein ANO11243_071660 [fungal sp. No.11243]